MACSGVPVISAVASVSPGTFGAWSPNHPTAPPTSTDDTDPKANKKPPSNLIRDRQQTRRAENKASRSGRDPEQSRKGREPRQNGGEGISLQEETVVHAWLP
ncbi:hypothetical protein VUR80DRAFT_3154 [Thermomyces stellatus]